MLLQTLVNGGQVEKKKQSNYDNSDDDDSEEEVPDHTPIENVNEAPEDNRSNLVKKMFYKDQPTAAQMSRGKSPNAMRQSESI